MSGRMDFRSRNTRTSSGVSAKGNTDYPAIAKIIGRGKMQTEDNKQIQSVYYGSGVYVAEHNNYGIVLTNWHVVSDSDQSIQVVFNNFTSEGIVLLADEIWDLAAIIIHKPPFLPVPISLEVPQIGENLWVAGYGQFPGLEGFEIQKGQVLHYMILGKREGLPAETMAISVGVRKGDSGGPILNRYGELSGLLWGSDEIVTVGTFSLRLQAFLTQAQYQLFNQPVSSTEFFTRKSSPNPIKMIQMASTPAQTALQACGIFPISTQPVYTTAKQNSSSSVAFYPGTNQNIPVTTASVINPQKPPYPPIESPTLFAQRKVIGREHPEVYPKDMLESQKQLTQLAQNTVNNKQKPAVSAPTRSDSTSFVNVALTQNNTEEHQNNPAASSNTPLDSPEPSPALSPAPAPNPENTNPPVTFKLGDIQTIVAIIIIFFLFFNAVRLLSIASEK